MPLKVARRGQIPPFIVMDVMRAASEMEAAGEDVVHLEVGQPGGNPPASAIRAAHAALDSHRLGYTPALGLPELRGAIADWYGRCYGITVPAERIVVTTGSSGAFVLSFLAAFEAGDRVALGSPGYPAYRNILSALGVQVVDIPVGADTHFQPTPAHLEALDPPIDGLIVASPNNPTGSMLSGGALGELAGWCEANGVRLISDEIYHGITFAESARTAAEVADHAVVVNSFSKYFAMTGWRLGWLVVPEDMLRAVECLGQNLFISPPTLSQLAGAAVFAEQAELDARVARYAENRAILLEGLPRAGFADLAPADGAFYIYADISHLTDDSPAFCRRMLAETGVATTPGVDFDPTRGHRFMRFSFAGTPDDMREAVRRLTRWMG